MTSRRKDRFVLPAVEKCNGFWNGRGLQREVVKGGLVNQTGATQYDTLSETRVSTQIQCRTQRAVKSLLPEEQKKDKCLLQKVLSEKQEYVERYLQSTGNN